MSMTRRVKEMVVLYVPSSLSSFSFSFLLSLTLSDLCDVSPLECELLHSALEPYSSSRRRPVSPLLNSSDILRAENIVNHTVNMGSHS